MLSIFASLCSSASVRTLALAGSAVDVIRCASLADLAARVRKERARALVVEIDPLANDSLIREVAVSAQERAIPLLLRAKFTPALADVALRLAQLNITAPISIEGAHALDRDLVRVLSEDDTRSAQLPLAGRLAALVHTPVRPPTVAAALISSARCSVAGLARVAGKSVRNLQWQFQAAGLGRVHERLGQLAALHLIWQFDVKGTTLKQIAAQAGYSSAETVAAFVRHYLGARPAVLRSGGGYPNALEQVLCSFLHVGERASVALDVSAAAARR
jgi:AraC-like DNA-binding protein